MSRPVLAAKAAIAEGLAEVLEGERQAARAYAEGSMCHCCCCTGECTLTFQESSEEEQAAWLANYWANVNRQIDLMV
ncbi:Hypothetical Protein OBI_RACECAR_34 [Arthrobacter phage Racecar]|nr:hypothetical protein PBI_RACECAR_115 [Arthrobacter phage Racecar]QFG12934.1 hypothetical protein PBI_MIMI_112 [Arthrobacter phage Mimi]